MSEIGEEHPKTVCNCFVGLWVDDIRPIPDDLLNEGWCCARSFHEAIIKLELMEFEAVSLDHDIASFYGNKEMSGQDIVWWLVDRKQQGKYTPPIIKVHSANPVGWAAMSDTVKRFL